MKICALIVAGGRGTRAVAVDAGSGAVPKQYALLGEHPLITTTLRAFLFHPRVDDALVVIHSDDERHFERAKSGLSPAEKTRLLPPVHGGANRQASVLAGLTALEARSPDFVLIHDAARPFVSATLIDGVIEKLEGGGAPHGAISAIPVADTLKRAQSDGSPVIAETVPRAGLWRAQTPQGFSFADILAAHRAAAGASQAVFTDDASIAEWAGLSVALVTGAASNEKITTAVDLEMARRRASEANTLRDGSQMDAHELRIGTGYDVHAFGPGDHLWVCGVRLEHSQTLVGHSDADVGLHALTDAILGALADGDIGSHFPPSDPVWQGVRSDRFLRHANERLRVRGGSIVNVDVTLVCEAPKIGPHRDAMRAAIATILDIDVNRVAVKATTSERLGFTGREEGMAAMASVSARLPAQS